MKLKNILLSGLSVVALASCSDYLDVEAPSKNELDYVYSDKGEIETTLKGIYASMLSNNTYGQNFLNTFALNSDVDFGTSNTAYATSTNYKRFDCDADGSHLLSAWTAQYEGIERANIFIEQLEKSPIYDEKEYAEDLRSMRGEAKVLRAIFYHDLTWMFGDVPFTFESSMTRPSSVIPMVDRTEMLATLIDDLKECADDIKTNADQGSIERIGREMAWAMIARLSLTAGGYSLRPEGGVYGTMKRPENYTVNGKTYDYKDFYATAMEYAYKVIEGGTHSLRKPFHQVFVDECNFVSNINDDPIFEIPFGSESTGRIGYIHGPKADALDDVTPHKYGKTTGGATLNALYRFMFEEGDVRRAYVNQLWGYDNQAKTKIKTDRTIYNGKWSKLWNAGGMGAQSSEQTGINYPLMRYADVLLMFAEAVNEVENGFGGEHGDLANAAYKEVRTRAFPNNAEKVKNLTGASKDDILKAILDERKFEFAGENMRWRDLVRNNLYNQQVFYTFWRYYKRAMDEDDAETEAISMFDFGESGRWDSMVLPALMYVKNDQDNTGGVLYDKTVFPNEELKVIEIANPYKNVAPNDPLVSGKGYTSAYPFQSWYDENNSRPVADVMYSLYGYIHQDDESGEILINNNGDFVPAPNPTANPTVESLPVLRYILPIPRTVIARVFGAYENKYGYR